jgi:hypothetical protein
MESYIQQKMKMKINGAANTDHEPSEVMYSNDNTNKETTKHEICHHAGSLIKEQVHRELAVAAARLAGKSENTALLDASGHQHC